MMSDQRPKRDSMSLEEATISNKWEFAGRNSVHGSVRRRQPAVREAVA